MHYEKKIFTNNTFKNIQQKFLSFHLRIEMHFWLISILFFLLYFDFTFYFTNIYEVYNMIL